MIPDTASCVKKPGCDLLDSCCREALVFNAQFDGWLGEGVKFSPDTSFGA